MKPRVLVATTVFGDPELAGVRQGYHEAILALCHATHLDFKVLGKLTENSDIVRARSRIVRDALPIMEPDDRVLIWDEDLVAPPEQIGNLIAALVGTGHDFVGVSYPKKRFYWNRVVEWIGTLNGRKPTSAELAEVAFVSTFGAATASDPLSYPIGPDGCADVPRLAMGFTLLSRRCLEKMVSHYGASPPTEERVEEMARKAVREWFSDTATTSDAFGPQRSEAAEATLVERIGRLVARVRRLDAESLAFTDEDVEGTRRETVALFQLLLKDRTLLTDDHSFGDRWRAIGGRIMMYRGPHANLRHIGPFAFGVPG